MRHTIKIPFLLIAILFSTYSSLSYSEESFIPKPPSLNSSNYILVDAVSGRVLAEKEADVRIEPASITKIMTGYVAADQISKGFVSLDDEVLISENCWRKGGSKMFIREGTRVLLSDLMKGMVIQSGNDASCAIAEHVAISEEGFVELMQLYVKELGMENTQFINVTGWPDPEHFSSARDLALLTKKLIDRFPDHYALYNEKYFTYNEIRQRNRNSLLWQDDSIDGIKTGHTKASGYCLVASSKRADMRLISIVLNSSSEKSRLQDTRRLLDYGFKYYQTKKIIAKYQPISIVDVWSGMEDKLELGPEKDIFITLTKPTFDRLTIEVSKNLGVKAPIRKDSVLDRLDIKVDGETIQSVDLVAVNNVQRKGIIIATLESLMFYVYSFFMQDEIN